MDNDAAKLNISGIRGIAKEFAAIIAGAIVLFGSAGTIHWARGWIYICMAFLYEVVYVSMLLSISPRLLNERGNLNWEETKLHDRFFSVFYPIFVFSTLIVAGFDAVRFKWSSIPFAAVYPGILVFILFSSVALWAYASNSGFILTHRNDKVSEQQVCTTGPYRYIRHPGYLCAIITLLCYPFIVGSWFSLIPVLLSSVLLVIRTYFEDKTLKIELKGYEEYSRTTRYRLLPYIW